MTFDMLNETFSQPNIIEGPEDWVNAFGSDAQAAFLATHDDESHDIRIWNISTLNIKTTLVGHTDDVHQQQEPVAQQGGGRRQRCRGSS